ncbi:hypothetical protein [Candidatus Magnetomonas plexicatena]|uniref:hypothetical protein n=1 Tax=Candidatus Magnetomonas plexicatena TaxID=2552947 RepID=UPI0011046219|nr:hypothetical protein E2O03_010095 [Nitrospirales bacterium LBB_01]
MPMCNVIFDGQIKDGFELEEVKAALRILLTRNDDEFLKKLFSGEKVIIKKDIDCEAAKSFCEHFNTSGAVAIVETKNKTVSGAIKQESFSEDEKAASTSQYKRRVDDTV